MATYGQAVYSEELYGLFIIWIGGPILLGMQVCGGPINTGMQVC